MSDEVNYKSNPLHGLGLKDMLTEVVTHYGFDILHAYLNINCFKTNPSIAGSVKFLKKTDWAREKVEVFYLYEYKNLPRVSSEQFKLPPRERIIPEGVEPKAPKELSLEDAERLNEKRAKKAAQRDTRTGARKGSSKSYNERRNSGFYKTKKDDKPGEPEAPKPFDPWGNFKGGS
jgi:uncharacterized protein (DUF2132 family)